MEAALDIDDPDACQAADPGGMFLAVAGSASQVREAAQVVSETDLSPLRIAGRPRTIVCTGMGGSGIAGDVLAAIAGPGCPVPIVTHKGYGLPGWVGATDLVLAVSCSGSTEETLSAAAEAHRRGVALAGVAAPGSPLADIIARSNGICIPVHARGRLPRALMWSLSVPLLLLAGPLGLDVVGADDVNSVTIEAAAVELERVAGRCRLDNASFLNPAKELAEQLLGALVMVWGTSPLTGVAAQRFACQLNENAKLPAIAGVLPEANHNQVVAFDGGWTAAGNTGRALQLLFIHDTDTHPQVGRRAEASRELAAERGLATRQITAEAGPRLVRFASLVGELDWVSVYLAVAAGEDPTPIEAISQLKARIAG